MERSAEVPGAPEGDRAAVYPVILFDGMCNLCNGAVTSIIRRDRKGHFRFAALQSEGAKSLLQSIGADRNELPDSMVLVEAGRAHVRSTAALRIARRLPFPWPLFYAFIILPRPLRDWMYDFIAGHRYRWFGRREECMIPTSELQERFLS